MTDAHRSVLKTMVGIELLPIEILLQVFSLFLPNPSAFQSCPTYYSSLQTLAQICRSWRNAILNAPQLWSFIDPSDGTEFYRNALKRSGQAPLVIRRTKASNNHRDQGDPTWPQLVEHTSRWKEAIIGVCTCEDLNLLSRRKAPQLTVLALICDPSVRSPLNLFDGHAPKLQHLLLHDINGLADWSILASLPLRSLLLSLVCPLGPSFQQFCHILQNLRQLKILSVTQTTFTSDVSPIEEGDIILLSELEALLIDSSLPENIHHAIFQRLRLPKCRSFMLGWDHTGTGFDEVTLFVRPAFEKALCIAHGLELHVEETYSGVRLLTAEGTYQFFVDKWLEWEPYSTMNMINWAALEFEDQVKLLPTKVILNSVSNHGGEWFNDAAFLLPYSGVHTIRFGHRIPSMLVSCMIAGLYPRQPNSTFSWEHACPNLENLFVGPQFSGASMLKDMVKTRATAPVKPLKILDVPKSTPLGPKILRQVGVIVGSDVLQRSEPEDIPDLNSFNNRWERTLKYIWTMKGLLTIDDVSRLVEEQSPSDSG